MAGTQTWPVAEQLHLLAVCGGKGGKKNANKQVVEHLES